MRQEVKIEQAINLTKYPDKTLEGYYMGCKTIAGKFNEQIIHTVQKSDNKKVQIYGFTSLNINLEQIERGVYVWITYTGKSVEKNKFGNNSHTCKVEYDIDKRLDLPKVDKEEEDDDENSLPF